MIIEVDEIITEEIKDWEVLSFMPLNALRMALFRLLKIVRKAVRWHFLCKEGYCR